MIFNTSSAQGIDRALDGGAHLVLFKQIAFGFIGVGVGFFLYYLGYEKLLDYSIPLFIFGTGLLLLILTPHVGQTVNGARRWIHFLGVSFQPSELIKLFLPLFYIHWFSKQKDVHFRSFVKNLLILSIPMALILVQPDNGTTAILVALLIMLFFLTRIRLLYWALPLSVMLFFGGIAAYQMPHVSHRIQVYMHPELDLRGKGHQPYQAKIATGSGGVLGRGFGESIQKLNYLPEARNDYIAAIYAEEVGFLGVLGLIGLYLLLSYTGFSIAMHAKDREGFLLGASLTFLINIQAFLNLGVVSGLLPSKGMTLPFFSQGGTSLLVNIVFIFLLLDIARKKKAYV